MSSELAVGKYDMIVLDVSHSEFHTLGIKRFEKETHILHTILSVLLRKMLLMVDLKEGGLIL